MWPTLLDNLNEKNREFLRENGVSRQLIHAWKNGVRLPTEVQVALLAATTGVNRHHLQDEIALARATPEQRKLLERLMGKARGAVVMLICGVSVAVACAALGLSGGVPGRLFARR